jgi:hypothetical protein
MSLGCSLSGILLYIYSALIERPCATVHCCAFVSSQNGQQGHYAYTQILILASDVLLAVSAQNYQIPS